MLTTALLFLMAFGLAYIVGHAEVSYFLRHILWNLRIFHVDSCAKCGQSFWGPCFFSDDIDPSTVKARCKCGHGQFISRVGPGSRTFRWVVKLMECPACFGFWEGLLVGIYAALRRPFPGFEGLPWLWMQPLWMGLAVSGANFILGRLTGLIPAKHPASLVLINPHHVEEEQHP